MADKGILLNDQVGGRSYACADLRNNDDQANARLVSLTSNVTTPAVTVGSELGTPIRTIDFYQTVGESSAATCGDTNVLTFAGMESDIKTNTLDCSDASAFVLYANIDMADETFTGTDKRFIQITPIAFTDALDAVVMPMHPSLLKAVSSIVIRSSDDFTNTYQDIVYNSFDKAFNYGTYKVPTVPLVYPTLGIKNFGFHICTTFSLASLCVVKLFGYALSGAQGDAALAYAVHANNSLVSASIPRITAA